MTNPVVFTYQARDAAEYQDALFKDPRPWWYQAKPRAKARYKNVRLTKTLHVKQPLERDVVAASHQITNENPS
jgi:hypothetical protein